MTTGAFATLSSYATQENSDPVYEDIAIYTCEDGYRVENMVGDFSASVVCKSDGTWSHQIPVNCTRKLNNISAKE